MGSCCCASRADDEALTMTIEKLGGPQNFNKEKNNSQADRMTKEFENKTMEEKKEVVDMIVATRQTSVRFDDIYSILSTIKQSKEDHSSVYKAMHKNT